LNFVYLLVMHSLNIEHTSSFKNRSISSFVWQLTMPICHLNNLGFLARDVIYTSRAYATMSVSVCLSVMEVHWRM